MPGLLTPVDVRTRDGRVLHAEVGGPEGTGRPTVVFEAGMGASSASWGAVVPLVVDRARVATYDRSGLGRSAADPSPRPLRRLADDLLDVLDHLGDGPFVLVGHSWGGPIIRLAAADVADRAAGLVLVDATDEGCDLFFSAGSRRQTSLSKVVLPVTARLGLIRIGTKRLARDLPEPAASDLVRLDGTPGAVRTMLAELDPHIADLERLRDDPPAEPDAPITVITGTVMTRIERSRRPDLIEAHRRRAAAAAHGRHVTADRSSHYVPFTEPDLVAAEVLRLVDPAGPPPDPTIPETPS